MGFNGGFIFPMLPIEVTQGHLLLIRKAGKFRSEISFEKELIPVEVAFP